jgi:thiol-disulfide isomerase/thioredoxin
MASTSHIGFMTRLGLVVAAPSWALAVAGDRRHPGRSGSDLMRAMGCLVLAGHLRGLVVALWLAISVDATLGFRTLSAVLSASLTMPLAFLVLSAGLLWLTAGKARHMGRAFDLAAVATVPLVLVLLVGISASLLVSSEHGAPMVGFGVLGLGFGWSGALVSLAVMPSRMAVSVAAVPTAAVLRRGRRAGAVVLAAIAVAVAAQALWVIEHRADLRPVTEAQPAPTISLPEIGRGGALQARVDVVSAARKRPVLVEFWATWCEICKRGLPHLEALRKAHPELEVRSINLDDPAKARQIFDDKGYGIQLLFDDAGAADRYGVAVLPHLVLIDSAGQVQQVIRGQPKDLEAVVRNARL